MPWVSNARNGCVFARRRKFARLIKTRRFSASARTTAQVFPHRCRCLSDGGTRTHPQAAAEPGRQRIALAIDAAAPLRPRLRRRADRPALAAADRGRDRGPARQPRPRPLPPAPRRLRRARVHPLQVPQHARRRRPARPPGVRDRADQRRGDDRDPSPDGGRKTSTSSRSTTASPRSGAGSGAGASTSCPSSSTSCSAT